MPPDPGGNDLACGGAVAVHLDRLHTKLQSQPIHVDECQQLRGNLLEVHREPWFSHVTGWQGPKQAPTPPNAKSGRLPGHHVLDRKSRPRRHLNLTFQPCDLCEPITGTPIFSITRPRLRNGADFQNGSPPGEDIV